MELSPSFLLVVFLLLWHVKLPLYEIYVYMWNLNLELYLFIFVERCNHKTNASPILALRYTIHKCIIYVSLSSCWLCSQGNRLTPGVIYVGHLPIGLFEPQLKSYFEQFGKVLRLRLSRSKKVAQMMTEYTNMRKMFPHKSLLFEKNLWEDFEWFNMKFSLRSLAQTENGLRLNSDLGSDNWAYSILVR